MRSPESTDISSQLKRNPIYMNFTSQEKDVEEKLYTLDKIANLWKTAYTVKNFALFDDITRAPVCK